LIAYRQLKKNKNNTNISIQDWFNRVCQNRPGQSQEFFNSIWVLLSNVLGKKKSWLVAHTDHMLEPDQVRTLNELTMQLKHGVPLAYLIGHWSFFGLDFHIDHSVLIPRPETELLVEKAIAWLKANPSARSMAEVGIGSGCISIALAKSFYDLNIIATDISFQALQISKKNINYYSLSNISLIASDLLGCLDKKFDLICANLPYIPTQDLKSLSVGRYEPLDALDGGGDGLIHIKRLLQISRNFLAHNSLLLMEIESTKFQEVEKISRQFFPDASIQICNDLAGKPRLLMVQSRCI
jgi:release factor glutamine methyltransferase